MNYGEKDRKERVRSRGEPSGPKTMGLCLGAPFDFYQDRASKPSLWSESW
jgi:hypothetical protein